jgi:hypothetical protein
MVGAKDSFSSDVFLLAKLVNNKKVLDKVGSFTLSLHQASTVDPKRFKFEKVIN